MFFLHTIMSGGGRMSIEPRYYIRQPGGEPQGPFSWTKIQRYVSEGRVRAEMEFSEDGQSWWLGSDGPALFPEVKPPPTLRAPGARGGGRGPRRVRAQRAQPRRGKGLRNALIVLGALIVVSVAVSLSSRQAREREAVERIRQAPFVPRNDTPSRSSGSSSEGRTRERSSGGRSQPEQRRPSRSELRAKMIKLLGGIPEGVVGNIGDNGKQIWFDKIGRPDRTQSAGGRYLWYYGCSDGTIQVVVSGAIDQGDDLFAVEGINNL